MDIIRFIGTPRFNGKSIIYNAVIREYYNNGSKVKVETRSLDFDSEGFIFANEFLARVNSIFGTNYEFSESYKNEVGKKHGNIDMHKDFAIKGSWADKWEILHHYDYDNTKNCTATYGEYTKEVILAFADAVDAYNKGKEVVTDYNPTYKMDEKRAEIAKEYDDNTSAVDAEVNKAISALEGALSGDTLTNAINATRSGYHWTYSRIRDKKWDAERNIYLDEMESVAKDIKSHIKRYKDYFTDEIVNTKRDAYYSSDDRYHSISYLEYNENKGDSYFRIIPYETLDDKLRFKFEGLVEVERAIRVHNNFSLVELTLEELVEVNSIFNEVWYNAMWKRVDTFSTK